jgi:hypothetical protein
MPPFQLKLQLAGTQEGHVFPHNIKSPASLCKSVRFFCARNLIHFREMDLPKPERAAHSQREVLEHMGIGSV